RHTYTITFDRRGLRHPGSATALRRAAPAVSWADGWHLDSVGRFANCARFRSSLHVVVQARKWAHDGCVRWPALQQLPQRPDRLCMESEPIDARWGDGRPEGQYVF